MKKIPLLFLEKGADIENLDNNKRTPLMNAVLQPKVSEEVVMGLIDNGAIFKDDKGIFGQYDGMANVLTAHAAKMCNYVNGKDNDSE